MKRILLSALAFSTLSVFAQEAPQECILGNSPTSATDNFKSNEDYGTADGGVFWFGADKNGSVITYERDSQNGQLDVTVNQANAIFEPLGFGLGDSNGDGTGTPVTMDLTDNPVFEISVTNNDLNYAIQTRLAIQDVKGYLVELNTDAVNSSPYLGQIVVTIEPGQTEILKGTFAGGYQGFYNNVDTCASLGAVAEGGDDACIVQKLDYTKVSTVLVTIINAEQPADNAYQPLPLVNASVSLNYIKIGAECDFVSLGLTNGVRTLSTTLFPNPATSTLNFSEELQNVTIFNSKGTQVFSAAKAKSVNVAEFSNGIYFLQTEKGSKSFIVE